MNKYQLLDTLKTRISIIESSYSFDEMEKAITSKEASSIIAIFNEEKKVLAFSFSVCEEFSSIDADKELTKEDCKYLMEIPVSLFKSSLAILYKVTENRLRQIVDKEELLSYYIKDALKTLNTNYDSLYSAFSKEPSNKPILDEYYGKVKEDSKLLQTVTTYIEIDQINNKISDTCKEYRIKLSRHSSEADKLTSKLATAKSELIETIDISEELILSKVKELTTPGLMLKNILQAGKKGVERCNTLEELNVWRTWCASINESASAAKALELSSDDKDKPKSVWDKIFSKVID